MAPPRKKRTGNPAPRRKSGRRNVNSAPSTPSSSKSLSNLLSLDSIGDLRGKTKQWLQYLQQADRVLDTLYVAGNSMNESGLLQKIIKNKGKNLSTGDLASILTALINTPLAEQFLKGWGGSGESGTAEAPAGSSQQPQPGPSVPNGAQGMLPPQQQGPMAQQGPMRQPGPMTQPPNLPPNGYPQYSYQQPPYPQQYQQSPYPSQFSQQFQPYYQQPQGLPPAQPPAQSQANFQQYQAPPISLLNAPATYNPFYAAPLSTESFTRNKKKTAK